MNPRTTMEIDAPRRLRAQRREAGLVAQYIHELSDRHAGTRRASAAARDAHERMRAATDEAREAVR